MADTSKAQKLASARKKFLELKKEKKKQSTPKTGENQERSSSSREPTPIDNDLLQPNAENSQVASYFNSPPSAFFDTFTPSPVNAAPATESISNYFNNQNYFSSDDLTPPQPLSSVESLKQLSEEMAQLIQPNSDFMPTNLQSELELRNQELASLLSREKVKTDELSATITEYQQKFSLVERDLREDALSSDKKLQEEIIRLKEELQSYIQTVGILVAEKTELSANLSQFQLTARQKTSECEELQGRLKTSRSRVADLEREVNVFKNEKSEHSDQGDRVLQDFHKLQQDFALLKQEKDEMFQDLLETQEKLKTSSENNLIFQQQVGELSSQLSLANIKIQQLTTGGFNSDNAEIETLTQQKFSLEKQLSELNLTVKSLAKEREESSVQYQQYAQQLNAQLTNLAARLEELQRENESLSNQEQSRTKHIGELEKQLQSLQTDQVNFAISQKPGAGDSLVRKELEERLSEIEEENLRLGSENEELLKRLGEKEETVKGLGEMVEELRGSRPDNVKLLAVMESDKVAAARAVKQNVELKEQMETMQQVFMKLDNDKVDLTEKLTAELKSNKDLIEKLQKTEIHLQTLADAIEIKDKELQNLRENSLELNKQIIQSEQLSDRLRHYEAQHHGSDSLQTELQEARQTIFKLSDEIHRLTDIINRKREEESDVDGANGDRDRDKDAVIEDLREVVEKLQKNQLDGNDHNDNVKLDKESAMKHLEAKFLKTMEDIANLTDEKQRLEHLVLQLQTETETIGEYVALYQHQRCILKQKALEKDQQLSQLENDREHMKLKLEKLNELVRKLVLEKGSVPSELLLEHQNLQNGHGENGESLCEEHARIHNEIYKITQQTQQNINPDGDGGGNKIEGVSGRETAEQIISLLAEIKSSNLVQPSENFHHCPWCSGQLITV